MKTLLDRQAELKLNDFTLLFDSAEEMNFWITDTENMHQISLAEAKRMRKFLDFWLNRVEKIIGAKDETTLTARKS